MKSLDSWVAERLFALAIVKGLVEHSDGTSYFGSLGGYQSHWQDAARWGWVLSWEKRLGLRVPQSEASCLTREGEQLYTELNLKTLPSKKYSRAYAWDWSSITTGRMIWTCSKKSSSNDSFSYPYHSLMPCWSSTHGEKKAVVLSWACSKCKTSFSPLSVTTEDMPSALQEQAVLLLAIHASSRFTRDSVAEFFVESDDLQKKHLMDLVRRARKEVLISLGGSASNTSDRLVSAYAEAFLRNCT